MTDITIRDKGNRWEVVPMNDTARVYLMNETGAVPWQWKNKSFVISKKEKNSYDFLDYLNNSGYIIGKE